LDYLVVLTYKSIGPTRSHEDDYFLSLLNVTIQRLMSTLTRLQGYLYKSVQACLDELSV